MRQSSLTQERPSTRHPIASRQTASRVRPLLLADWERALFMHFELPPQVLQRHVPFALDLFEGRAFVSLVAFTMSGMRPAWGGRWSRWLCAPLAHQRFLNLRTYVRCGSEVGIYFIAEWISHGLCVPFGPITYGLPYRWGKLAYRHEHEQGSLNGRVTARRGGGGLAYEATVEGTEFEECSEGGLEEFLLERYVAYTQFRGRRRQFRIFHAPWQQAPARVHMKQDDLLGDFASWWPAAQLAAAQYSPGSFGVRMGRPEGVVPAAAGGSTADKL